MTTAVFAFDMESWEQVERSAEALYKQHHLLYRYLFLLWQQLSLLSIWNYGGGWRDLLRLCINNIIYCIVICFSCDNSCLCFRYGIMEVGGEICWGSVYKISYTVTLSVSPVTTADFTFDMELWRQVERSAEVLYKQHHLLYRYLFLLWQQLSLL